MGYLGEVHQTMLIFIIIMSIAFLSFYHVETVFCVIKHYIIIAKLHKNNPPAVKTKKKKKRIILCKVLQPIFQAIVDITD